MGTGKTVYDHRVTISLTQSYSHNFYILSFKEVKAEPHRVLANMNHGSNDKKKSHKKATMKFNRKHLDVDTAKEQ